MGVRWPGLSVLMSAVGKTAVVIGMARNENQDQVGYVKCKTLRDCLRNSFWILKTRIRGGCFVIVVFLVSSPNLPNMSPTVY